MPPESPVAWTVFGLVAWLLQGKAYPLLAFLFGYSQALALRGRSFGWARQRLHRLIGLGVVHGALLFAGDVLTMYGLCGLWVLAHARTRLRMLLRSLWLWLLLALAACAATFVWVTDSPTQAWVPISYASVDGAAEFVMVNAAAYAASLVVGLVLVAPEIILLMLSGLIAGRLGLLSRRRWRALVERISRIALPLGLALNAGYAVAATWVSHGQDARAWPGIVGPIGWLLAGGFAAALANAWQAGPPALLRALVPLGRYTLSLYVGVSLFAAVALSGAGLAWPLGTSGLAAVAVLLWCGAWAAAHAARGRRGPLEAWMARP
jgi:uncharacterized protein